MSLLIAADFAPEALHRWADQVRELLPGITVHTARDPAADAGIEMALVANPPPGVLRDLPRLRFVQSMWAGVDKLLRDPTIPQDLQLARMVDSAMTAAMAETAQWAVLSLHRGFFRYAAQQRDRLWNPLPQRRADEVHVAVLGLGEMGRAAANRLARDGYRVSGWSRRSHTIEGVTCHQRDPALPKLLGEADIVVNLLPLTARTNSLFNAATFAHMKRGAGFVNLARGQQVVEGDLLSALDKGQVGHAVLDVFQVEPLPTGHAFWTHPSVTLLPHSAAQTDLRSATTVAAANLRAFSEGRPVSNRVDRARGY